MTVLTPLPPASATPLEGKDAESVQMAKNLKLSRPLIGWLRNTFNVLKPGETKQVVIGGTTLTFVNGIFTGSSP